MHPIKVFLLIMLTLAGSSYRNHILQKEMGEKLFNKLYEMEQRILPESIEAGVPIYSANGYAKIRTLHDCQQLVYEEFQLWK